MADASDRTPHLRVRDLHVTRGGQDVVRGVDLDAHRGEVLAILGPNGAGKSTLLRAIAGLLPARGDVEVDGAPVSSWSGSTRATRIAYVPQRSELAAMLPVERVVAQGRYAHGHDGVARRRTVDAMRRADVLHFAERPFPRLSVGEQRRVLVARALATDAPLLLFDEPTASLDVGHALSLLALLRELAADGHAVVVVLHPLDEAARFTDRAVLLDEGRVAASGPTREVLRPGPVRAVYGVELIDGGALGFARPEDVG